LFALLTAKGYECLAAETPIQARARLISNHPDLIIIDHGLPGEDGASLAKVLKRISEVPVLCSPDDQKSPSLSMGTNFS